VPVARWIALAVNSLMLVATPIDGSHYFADVLAGVAIAALSLAVARAVVARVAGFPAAMELRTAPVSPRWGDPGPVEIDGQMSR
jgi:membrane-associated phospholipid phosphatase